MDGLANLEPLHFFAAAALVMAAVAWIGDWRRTRRKNLDRVGFMPWAPIFFVSLIAAITLGGLVAQLWIAR